MMSPLALLHFCPRLPSPDPKAMANRTHQRYHINTWALLHPLHSVLAELHTPTPRSFLRSCWSTNSQGFGGVDRSQWKLQTHSGAAANDASTNKLQAPVLTKHTPHLRVHAVYVYMCACVCWRLHFERHNGLAFTRSQDWELKIALPVQRFVGSQCRGIELERKRGGAAMWVKARWCVVKEEGVRLRDERETFGKWGGECWEQTEKAVLTKGRWFHVTGRRRDGGANEPFREKWRQERCYRLPLCSCLSAPSL